MKERSSNKVGPVNASLLEVGSKWNYRKKLGPKERDQLSKLLEGELDHSMDKLEKRLNEEEYSG